MTEKPGQSPEQHTQLPTNWDELIVHLRNMDHSELSQMSLMQLATTISSYPFENVTFRGQLVQGLNQVAKSLAEFEQPNASWQDISVADFKKLTDERIKKVNRVGPQLADLLIKFRNELTRG